MLQTTIRVSVKEIHSNTTCRRPVYVHTLRNTVSSDSKGVGIVRSSYFECVDCSSAFCEIELVGLLISFAKPHLSSLTTSVEFPVAIIVFRVN